MGVPPTETVVPFGTETVALAPGTETEALPLGTETVALAPGTETEALPLGTETVALAPGNDTWAPPPGTDTVPLPPGTLTVAVPPGADTVTGSTRCRATDVPIAAGRTRRRPGRWTSLPVVGRGLRLGRGRACVAGAPRRPRLALGAVTDGSPESSCRAREGVLSGRRPADRPWVRCFEAGHWAGFRCGRPRLGCRAVWWPESGSAACLPGALAARAAVAMPLYALGDAVSSPKI